ncbi:uncharacterized protein RCC_07753 [Ramularia collo-cygni]|uniref:beta-glucosidase n=1 Tax=Ramularia collo-cygni TaxID=112498 RepID=A0A2D3VAR1_9PEZI|nr:uncharacterized protein RCC_07753 [Ramularia collo-cygni]CZT21887.1 uncharacterized protein RCC_07753 [Ramularia collo-cygni]
MSMANFDLSDLQCAIGSGLECTTVLTNTGSCAAAQVVQLYVRYPQAAHEPPKLLKAFVKVHLEPQQSRTVQLEISVDDLRVWSASEKAWSLVQGNYTLVAGFSATDLFTEVTVML